jgi:hypothetical protein
LEESKEELSKHAYATKIIDFMLKIVKKSLHARNYNQIGRLPRFFNARDQKFAQEFNLIVWPGYFCDVKLLTAGIFLQIDAASKFLKKETILDIMNKMKRDHFSNEEINKQLCPKFDDTMSDLSQSSVDKRRMVVITTYNPAEYQIDHIAFDKNPKTHYFEWNRKN